MYSLFYRRYTVSETDNADLKNKIQAISVEDISRISNSFTRKSKRCYASFPMLYTWPLLSRGHQRAWIKWFATLIWPLESETRTYSITKKNLFCSENV